MSLQLRDPKLREEGEGQCCLVFEEFKRLFANRGFSVMAALPSRVLQGVFEVFGENEAWCAYVRALGVQRQ